MIFLVVGDANVDASGSLARFPREGEDAPLRALSWGSGGAAANVATALARLGASARLLSRVGDDPSAERAIRAARSAGVDLDHVQRDGARPTGFCLAAVSPGGERTFFSHRGACVAIEAPGEGFFDDAGSLHIGGHALIEGASRDTALSLIERCRRSRIPTSLDLCLPLLEVAPASTLDMISRVDVLFANELELALLAGAGPGDPIDRALSALTDRGVPLVVAKLGARGSAVRGLDRADAPAFQVDAIDTTGAGDACVAGFLFARARGAPASVAARLGNALGALTATRAGAADALPSRAEVIALLAAHGATAELDVLRSTLESN